MQIAKNKKWIVYKKNPRITYLYAFFLTAFLFICIYALVGKYPFGNNNNIVDDEYLQYVDFFCFFRNVLMGEARLDYSISKSLGGNTMALFGYYLSSPFNLLVVLFNYDQMQLFIFLITILKISFSSVTCIFFLFTRFPNFSRKNVLVLGVCYALSAYSVGQSANLMWLDGVYMLPLLMSSVYLYTTEKRGIPLSLCTGCTIIFNWYTGYMNCLFIPFYYLLEMSLTRNKAEPSQAKAQYMQSIGKFLHFCLYEFLGVLLSSVLFFPVVYGLLHGKGNIEEGILKFNTEFRFLELVGGWLIGNQRIWIYCSLFVLLFIVLFFVSKSITKREKICIGFLFIFTIGIIYFTPISNVFNGFRFAYSFKYRAAYITIMMCIYIAAYMLFKVQSVDYSILTVIGVCLAAVFFLYELITGASSKYVIYSVIVVLTYAYILSAYADSTMPKGLFLLVLGILSFELVFTGGRQLQNIANYQPDASIYSHIQKAEMNLIQELKESDPALYRINTARTVNIAKANSGMAYNFPTISHYDSGFDLNVSSFLKDIGYSSETAVSLTDEPILPADALLGAKYLLTNTHEEKTFPGFSPVEYLENDEFQILKNEYVLPLAFLKEQNGYYLSSFSNPFEYINEIYSEILGRKIAIFKEVKPIVLADSDQMHFSTPVIVGSELYGYTFKHTSLRTTLYIDGRRDREYGGWLYQPVYYVGNGSTTHCIQLADYTESEDESGTVLYALDMDLFSSVIQELQHNTPSTLCIQDGSITATVTSNVEKELIITIPNDSGWTAVVNGRRVEIGTSCGLFMAIPLDGGVNTISLRYTAPWLYTGVIVSLTAIIILIFLKGLERRREKCFQ